MILAAFDLSLTSSGYAVAVDGAIKESGVIPGKGEGIPRLIQVRNSVCNKIDAAKPTLVIFEDFSFGSNMSGAREIAGLAYMIRAELFTDGVPYCCVSPLALKKYCVGTAGSSKQKVGKELVLMSILKRWGAEIRDNNAGDAFVLAQIGMALVGDTVPTIEPQKEVLAKLRDNNKWLSKLDAKQPEW